MGGELPSERGRETARYCSSCGTDLESSMNYCPNCGTETETGTAPEPESGRSTGGSATDRRRPTGGTGLDGRTDRELLERRIAAAAEEGWELEHDFGDHAVLIRRSFGSTGTHLLIALFTIWFTMGFGNALYAGYKYFGDVERRVVRPDGPSETAPIPGPTSANDSEAARTAATANDAGSDGFASAKLIFGVGLIWLFGLALLLEGSLLASGFGVVLLATGAAMIPSVRRRVRDREPITVNGRTRSIEERDVRAPERSCTVCRRSTDEGIERTYRERFRLLGVSLVTTDSGTNYYCRTCAGLESGPHDEEPESETDDADTGSKPRPETEPDSTPAETGATESATE